MSDKGFDKLPVTVKPESLIETLKGNGWEVVGFREDTYVRLKGRSPYGAPRPSIVIPLNRKADDFDVLMTGASETIRRLGESTWMQLMAPLLMPDPVDKIRFRKEASAPKGFIPWGDGVELIDGARRTLIAGAKAYMEPCRFYSNRFGQFARRYLDQILMGQSSIGSYVVNALVPTEAKVPIRKTADTTSVLRDTGFARGRDITSAYLRALEATSEALNHFRSSGSLSGFDDRVGSGISRELVIALRDVASGGRESDITIELTVTDQTTILPTAVDTHCFGFSGSDAGVLERASTQLSAPPESEHLRVRGRVHLLTRKEAGGPGVVGIDEGNYRYRVRFGSDEEYDHAVFAHYKDRHIVVEGDLSREGTIRWLYNAQLVTEPRTDVPNYPFQEPTQEELWFPQ